MVFVNIIAFLSLLAFLGIWKFLLHKKLNGYLLVLLLSLLPLISIFRKGVYESGDFNIHIYRSISFYENLQNLNFLPSWAGNLNAGFGYPLFIFINPLPYYLISIFHFLGFSYIASIKVFIIVTFILSGIFMLKFSKLLFKDKLAAIITSVFYLYAPYHLIDMHFRTDVGELTVFALFPLLLIFLYYCLKDYKTNYNFIALSIIYALIILSHQAIAFIIAGVFILLILALIFKHKHINHIIIYKLLISFLIAILISSYSWITYFSYTIYTNINLKSTFNIALLNLTDILFSPWRNGFLFQGPYGEVAMIIGYTQLFILGLTGYLLFKKKFKEENKKIVFFLFSSSLLLIFMMIEQSKIIWETIPLIKNILLSYRLHLILVVFISILAGYVSIELKNKKLLLYLIILITISLTILNWGNRGTIPEINDITLINNIGRSTFEGEGLSHIGVPKWTGEGNTWVKNNPNEKIEIIKGNASIQNIVFKPTHHIYLINAKSNLILKENTWFFPGWEIFANTKRIPINHTNLKYPGNITFELPYGNWYLEIIYKDLFYFRLIKLFSISVMLISVMYVIFSFLKHKKVLN